MMKITKDLLMEAQDCQVKYTNQHHRHEEFEIGNKVLLSTHNINNPVDKQRPTKKLSPKFIGPYIIIEKIPSVTYKLNLPLSLKIHPVFHISLLKSYNVTDEFERILSSSAIITSDYEEEYEVESILDKRIIHKKPQYLVKWTGYPLYNTTWKSLENLNNAFDLVQAFESSRK